MTGLGVVARYAGVFVAAHEQHGHHMPLPRTACCWAKLSSAPRRVWAATFCCHCSGWAIRIIMDFPGTLSAEPRAYLDLLTGELGISFNAKTVDFIERSRRQHGARRWCLARQKLRDRPICYCSPPPTGKTVIRTPRAMINANGPRRQIKPMM